MKSSAISPGVGAFLLLAAGLTAFGCGPDPEHAPRILSLSPPITQILVEIGSEALVVDPAVADAEQAVALRPTLVLAVRTEAHRAFLDTLRARGLEVRDYAPTTMADVKSSFREISALAGHEDRTDALIKGLMRELAAISAAVSGRPRPDVALVIRRDPLSVAGGGSLLHDLIEIAGGQNLFEHLAAPVAEISPEELAAADPDAVIDASLSDGPDAAEREFWEQLPWVRRVEYLPGSLASLPTLDVVRRASKIQERLYPAGVSVGGRRRR